MEHHSVLKFLPSVPVGSNFIDFGPSSSGKGLLSRYLINQLPEHGISCVSHPRPLVIVPERVSPKRSTKRVVRQATLLKCAILNEVLESVGLLNARFPAVELGMSWRDLGLTKVAHPAPKRSSSVPPTSNENIESLEWYQKHVVRDELSGDIKVLTSDAASEELEQRTSVALTEAAVKFTDCLSAVVNRRLPPTLLVMCPTVVSVIELWDAVCGLGFEKEACSCACVRVSYPSLFPDHRPHPTQCELLDIDRILPFNFHNLKVQLPVRRSMRSL